MKTKIQILLIPLLLALPFAVQAQFTYTTNNGTITITGYTGTNNNVTIPATINGLSVTSIGDDAFYNDTALTSVTIPDSVTSIGDASFEYCNNLTSVTTGNGVTNIGVEAFYECYDLTNVLIGSSVISIGDDAFEETALTSVTIPDSVTSIGDGAFYNDTALTNVMIGSGVTNIGDDAFYRCYSLTAINVDAANSFYDGVNGVLFDKNQTALIQYPIGNTSVSYAIPDSVTNIGNSAFASCSNLTSVTISDNVTSIGDYAFWYCQNLKSVTIPNSVTSIGDGAFVWCSSLTNVMIGNGVTNIGVDAFFDCRRLTSVFIAANAPIVGDDAFSFYPGGQADYNIPLRFATVYYLSGTTGWNNTFAGLPTVMLDGPPQFGATTNGWQYLSDGVQIIITGYANSNNDVTIPSTISNLPVTSIGGYAFYECGYLTSVTIPDSVTSIGDFAFDSCYNLTSVYFSGNAPTVDSFAFDGDSATAYYLPGTLGWSNTFAGLPTALWYLPNPLILNKGPGFGVQSNQFGFTVSWATNVPVVVEACSNLSNPAWLPVSTNNLVSGASYFSDPQPANLPSRFYRLRSP